MTDGGEGPAGRKYKMTVTHKHNLSIAKRGKKPICTYTRKKYSGSNNPKSKKCLSSDGILYDCAKDAAEKLNLNVKTVQYRCRMKIKGWSYIDI